MGSWGITMRQSDYGLDLLGTIVDTQLKAVNFLTFKVTDALEVIKADMSLLSINLSGQASCTVTVKARSFLHHIEVSMSLNQINGKTPLKSWRLSGTGPLSETKTKNLYS